VTVTKSGKSNKPSPRKKPLSLHPLTPEQALRLSLQVKPPKKATKKKPALP